MSYTETMVFTVDGLRSGATYNNSHGFGPALWAYLYNKYIKAKWVNTAEWWRHQHDCWMLDEKPLWALQSDDRLSGAERVGLMSTFDNCLIRKDDLPALATQYRNLHPILSDGGKLVSHFGDLANELVGLAQNPAVIAVGFYGTSLVENPWTEYIPYDDTKDNEDDYEEYRDYNLETGTKHWFLEIKGE